MRAMLLEFPSDPTCAYLDRQYMLGPSLLVAPVFSYDSTVLYYVPAGRWTHFLTGTVVEGPGWIEETHDFLSLPLLVRPNTVLALGKDETRPDYEYQDGITLQVYELADGAEITSNVPTISGDVAVTFNLRREGNTIAVARRGAIAEYRLLLVNIDDVVSIDGGTWERSEQGVLVTAANDVDGLRIGLKATR
jgi:alpha-D-xyloside xylohydrolase